jgi:hypothetical protein
MIRKMKTRVTQIDIEEFTASSISSARLEQKLKYKQKHLKNLGTWVSKNLPEVKELASRMNSEDSDYFTISIYHLINNTATNDNVELQKSLDAFLNLEDENWYPSVTFIKPNTPSIQVRVDGNQNDKPIIALEKIVNGEQTYEGYEQNELDELELIYETLVEEEHSSREMFLMELSQCGEDGFSSGDDAFLNCDDVIADGNGGNGGSGSGSTSTTARIRINKMTVKQHKERWPGRSEVHFIGFTSTGLPVNSGYCGDNIAGSLNCYNPNGKRIDRFKRRWIGDERTMNYLVKEDPSTANPDHYLFYRIFEQDSWPAPKKGKLEDFDEHIYFPNGEYRIIEYRSWQGSYDKQLLSQNYNNPYELPFTNGFSAENGDIKYNLTRGQ